MSLACASHPGHPQCHAMDRERASPKRPAWARLGEPAVAACARRPVCWRPSARVLSVRLPESPLGGRMFRLQPVDLESPLSRIVVPWIVRLIV